MGLQDDIVRAIDDSGLSLYRIAQDNDMQYALLHRFYHSKTDARLSTADKLVDYLGLRLQPVAKSKRKKRAAK